MIVILSYGTHSMRIYKLKFTAKITPMFYSQKTKSMTNKIGHNRRWEYGDSWISATDNKACDWYRMNLGICY